MLAYEDLSDVRPRGVRGGYAIPEAINLKQCPLNEILGEVGVACDDIGKTYERSSMFQHKFRERIIAISDCQRHSTA
jgi:hypothetical protein